MYAFVNHYTFKVTVSTVEQVNLSTPESTRTNLEDELRVGGSHFLDVHPSLGASNHDWAVAGPIHQDGKVGLPADVQGLGHHHLAAARRRPSESERVREWSAR